MDKEIIYINNILKKSTEGLTTSEISKILYDEYDLKVSRTIVKNYLWSYFRNIIKYDSSNFTYSLDGDKFIVDDIDVKKTKGSTRPLSVNFEGSRVQVIYDEEIPVDEFIKAIAILNFRPSALKKKVDFIKQLNRLIEQNILV